jgi:glycosyltransferase involved in cell wall biosynthesis
VPKSDVPGLLAASDMEIHELQGFGIGIASMEAMCTELPTVMTERPDYFPGMYLENNQDTILLERGDTPAMVDAIVRLIEDENLRRRIGKAGRGFVFANLDMHKLCDANLQLLERVVAESA